jgi:membrane-associated phospholipid phosphatase
VTPRPGRLPDARRPELAHGLPRYGFWVSLCFRELGDCGCSTARARRGFVLGVTPEARRTTTARVPGDRDPGVPAEAALADPTGTGGFARTEDFAPPIAAGHSHPYPSGHALRSTILLGAVYLLGTSSLWRAEVALALLGLLASRVYLGTHWTSDVVRGALLGASAVLWAFGRED